MPLKLLSPLLFLCLILLSGCGLFHTPPPGTVEVEEEDVEERWYMDRSTITNENWGNYLAWIQREFSTEADVYQRALPDQDVWETVYERRGRDFSSPEVFFLQQNANFPVVGITYDQAQHFAQWRTNRVQDRTGENIVYKIPEYEHFERVAERYGFVDIGATDRIIPQRELPSTPEGGFRGLCVNVSEMTQTEGLAAGGNWENPSSQCPVRVEYDSPENWLGFRCIAIKE